MIERLMTNDQQDINIIYVLSVVTWDCYCYIYWSIGQCKIVYVGTEVLDSVRLLLLLNLWLMHITNHFSNVMRPIMPTHISDAYNNAVTSLGHVRRSIFVKAGIVGRSAPSNVSKLCPCTQLFRTSHLCPEPSVRHLKWAFSSFFSPTSLVMLYFIISMGSSSYTGCSTDGTSDISPESSIL